LKAEIESTQRCTWGVQLMEFGDALGGCNDASLEDTLGGYYRTRLEDYMETANGRRSKGGPPGADTLFISQFIQNHGNVD
jgi:hypothetical protein